MNLRPISGRIVVKPIEAEDTTAGGIALPDMAKKPPSQGIVVAVGPGETRENGELAPMDVELHDMVLYEWHQGTKYDVGGTKYLLLDVRDVLAVVEG